MATETKKHSTREQLRALVRLQHIDNRIDRIQKLRGDLPDEVRDLEDEIAGLQTRIDRLEQEQKESRVQQKEAELDIQEGQNKIEKYENQQNEVRNNREYDALTKEIEAQRQRIQQAETDIEAFTERDAANEQIIEQAEERLAELDDIREVIGSLHLNVRMALSPLFYGGKSALEWSDVAGRADSVTISFFGVDRSEMRKRLADLPAREDRPVSVYGGFIFHGPDCTSPEDVEARVELLTDADLDGVSAYCLSMATDQHLHWLTTSLQ